MQLLVRPELCTGCQSCEVACSLWNTGVMNPLRSRVSVIRWESKGFFVPVLCMQCEKAVCARVCPVGAITRNWATGAWQVDPTRCLGCRLCVVACPFGAIQIGPGATFAEKCDLCAGEPKCVAFCATGVISVVAVWDRRKAVRERGCAAEYLKAVQLAGRREGSGSP